MRSLNVALLNAAVFGISTRSQLVVGLNGQQTPLGKMEILPAMEAKRVAIIGAGAAGSSAAYHLRKYSAESNIPLNITIFERDSYIGGRSATVDAFDSPSESVELGASIFVDVNTILVNAAQEFNLALQPARDELPTGYKGPTLGIFNGDEFVFEQSTGTLSDTWDMVKLLWRYGLAPLRAQNAVKETVGNFLRMYDEAEGFPWKDLTEEVQRVGLLEQTGITGLQLLEQKGITGLFGTEIIQAATRVNYAQNLGVIHGVEAMVSMAPQGAKSVVGGNCRIFASMARFATHDIQLNTTVSDIIREKDGSYTIKHKSTKDGSATMVSESFDEVIIASPFQFTKLSISPELESSPDTIPYVKLHVTLVITPLLLNPLRFNLPPSAQVPLVVLTTLPPADQDVDGSKATYAGKPGFFSVSLLRPIINPKSGAEEYLYKVFSPEPFTYSDLSNILSVPEGRSLTNKADGLISWIYRKEWLSYPVEWPRVTFDKSLLAPGLWYTGGMDSFISTMETNALMGKNVAKLMLDEWERGPKPSPIGGEVFAVSEESKLQKPLKAKL